MGRQAGFSATGNPSNGNDEEWSAAEENLHTSPCHEDGKTNGVTDIHAREFFWDSA
jgi:hypothetical protein